MCVREEFEIKARSPFLVAIAEGTGYLLCMSVLLHWLLRSVGKALPCYVVFVVSYGGEIADVAVHTWLVSSSTVYRKMGGVENAPSTSLDNQASPYTRQVVEDIECRA